MVQVFFRSDSTFEATVSMMLCVEFKKVYFYELSKFYRDVVYKV